MIKLVFYWLLPLFFDTIFCTENCVTITIACVKSLTLFLHTLKMVKYHTKAMKFCILFITILEIHHHIYEKGRVPP